MEIERGENNEEEYEQISQLSERIADPHGGRDDLTTVRVFNLATGRQTLSHLNDVWHGGDRQ